MNKEYVLITGATGFIGAHVIEKFLSEDEYSIVAIVRSRNNYKNVDYLKQKGVVLIEREFFDNQLVDKTFEQFQFKYVVHIAALRGGGAGSNDDFFNVNVRGTEILLEASFDHGIKTFIFFSSVGVFGTIPKIVPADLETGLKGDNAYHQSKIIAEQKVQNYIKKGLNAYIVRPTITYGPEDNGFPATLIKLIKKRIFLLPMKDIKIHLLDVAGLATLVTRIVKSGIRKKRVFIAADKAPISLKVLADLIHNHYFGTHYPRCLKLPGPIFKIFLTVFQLMRNEKWATRILLISKSWYYDIRETVDTFQYLPSNTKDVFIERMLNSGCSTTHQPHR